MGRKYVNPPVIEAICEFRLTPDTNWDITIPGLFYEKVKEHFPHREQRIVQEIEVIQDSQSLQQQLRTSERILLFAENRSLLIQLGPRLLVVNALKPYPTWAGFKPKIEEAFGALSTTIELKGLQRVGLRYINRIEMPLPQLDLARYFQFYLYLGPNLPQNTDNFFAWADFVYADGRDRCRVQLKSVPDHIAVILDIDYFLSKEKGVPETEAINWIEEAHNRVEEVFEGCVTDQLRDLFQEVK